MKRIFNIKKGNKRIEYDVINNDKKMLDEIGWDLCRMFDGTEPIIVDELIDRDGEYENKTFIIDDLKSYNNFIAMLDNLNVRIVWTGKNSIEVIR